MGNGYFNLSVAEILQETEDTVSIVFELPDDIKGEFNYKPGQFVNIKTVLDGKTYVRSYSMSSSPHMDSKFIVTVKAIPDGRVSQHLVFNIHEGDKLLVSKPKGKFTINLDMDKCNNFIMFAAGSGITPLYSMIKSALYVSEKSKITLIYSNRSENSIIYKDLLDTLEAMYSGRFKTVHLLSRPSHDWSGLKGRLNEEIAQQLVKHYTNGSLPKAEFYLCGPNSFMETAEHALLKLNVSSDKIKSEKFNNVKEKKEDKCCEPELKQIRLGNAELKLNE